MTAWNNAQTAWKVIENNRPTATASSLYASALPKGVTADQLTGGGRRQISWRWDSGYVLKDFTLDVSVVWHHSSRYKNGGAWIPAAYVLPELNVGWLGDYTINVSVTAQAPFTTGTDTAPVACLPLLIEMHWTNWLFANVTPAQVSLYGNGQVEADVKDTYGVSL